MDRFYTRSAIMSEVRCICDFLINHFSDCNPLQLAYVHPQNENIEEWMKFVSQVVSEDLALMAFETSTSTLVGVLIGYSLKSKSEAYVEPSNADQSFSDIENILNYICQKANVCERFGFEEAFKIEIVSVHKNYRKKKIATALFEASIALARSKNFKLSATDCVSEYASIIAESLGMECVSTVTYDEYNEYIGKCLFVPVPPHMEIKTLIKKL